MQERESHLAEAALSALAERHCDDTGELLNRVNGQCSVDYHTHCPFCGAPTGEDCPHLLASWNNEEGYDGPPLPRPGIAVERLAECSDEQKREALGEFYELYAVYQEYAAAGNHPVGSFRHQLNENWLCTQLLPWIVARVPEIRMASWMPTAPGGAYGDVFYAAHPDRARALMLGLNDRVLRAYQAALDQTIRSSASAPEASRSQKVQRSRPR